MSSRHLYDVDLHYEDIDSRKTIRTRVTGYGNAPLVVRLDREDWGSKPWQWALFPDVNAGVGIVATVIAPPPTLEVAVDVGQIAARVLSGKAATGI